MKRSGSSALRAFVGGLVGCRGGLCGDWIDRRGRRRAAFAAERWFRRYVYGAVILPGPLPVASVWQPLQLPRVGWACIASVPFAVLTTAVYGIASGGEEDGW